MKYRDKTIMTVMMQWDYGIRERGISGDKTWFFDNLSKLANRVEPFWFDAYLENIEQLQIELIAKARNIQPDLIFFIPYTNQFSLETLSILKNEFVTYAWFGDDQWRFDDYSANYAPYFTHVSTTDPWSVSKYNKLGIQPIESQWAGQAFSDKIGPLKKEEQYEFEVSFIGGYNEYRSWFIKKIEENAIKVECFGAGWSNGRTSYEEMEQIFRKSKINLNISNSAGHDIRFVFGGLRNFRRWLISKKRAEQIKARNFEIPCSGGFQLSNYVLGLERYFSIGKEIAVYNSPEECTQQINFYLSNEQLREDIVLQSHKRAIHEHTFVNRLDDILEEIWR